MTQNPAIVLDLGVNGLGVVRSLGRRGVEVLGVSYIEPGVARRSRYCRTVDLGSADIGKARFLSHLLDLCRSLPAPPVLFPTSDEALDLISKYEEDLASAALFVIPERSTLLDLLNKDGTLRLARECGLPIPETCVFASAADLREAAPLLRYPVLYKPRNHYSVYLPGMAKNFTFQSFSALDAFFTRYPHLAPLGVFQEIIRGGDGHILVCAACLNRDSAPLAVYTGRKIRQLQPDFGVTCYGISEHLPELAELTLSFLQRIRFRGLVAVEWARDRETGQIYFIEANARAYYHNALFQACGVDLPWIAYMDAVRDPMLPSAILPRQTYGIRWLDLARDARSFRLKHRSGQLGWGAWLRSLPRARSFAVFAVDDLGPFLCGAARLVWRQLAKGVDRLRAAVGLPPERPPDAVLRKMGRRRSKAP